MKSFLKFLMTLLSEKGKSKILTHLQERFGNLLSKFKNAWLIPAHLLSPAPAVPLPSRDDHAGDPPPAVVEGDKEDFYFPRETVEEVEAYASTETISHAQCLTDLSTSSTASFLNVQPLPEFSLPSQEEAKILS